MLSMTVSAAKDLPSLSVPLTVAGNGPLIRCWRLRSDPLLISDGRVTDSGFARYFLVRTLIEWARWIQLLIIHQVLCHSMTKQKPCMNLRARKILGSTSTRIGKHAHFL